MKENKSQVGLIIAILFIAAIIAWVSYGIIKSSSKDANGNLQFGKNPVATMEVTYKDSEGNDKTGTIKMELDYKSAPNSVANFVNLANNGFYDGLTFHRIVSDFMIQGGDKNGDGTGSAKLSQLNKKIAEGSSDDYTYAIKGEFAANGVYNSLKFKKGVIGMARSDYSSYGLVKEGYDSGSTQFFIVTTDKESTLNSLNQQYAAFGNVIEGYDVVEAISKVEVKEAEQEGEEASTPVNAPIINSIKVDTFGAKYEIPETVNFDETMKTVQQYQNFYNQYLSSANQASTESTEEAEVTE